MPDIDIARAAALMPIEDIAATLDIPAAALYRYGPYKAKIDLDFVAGVQARQRGKLVLVTAISPTAAGEGKTTTTIGLGDGLRRLGHKVAICLREPSLGPCFGAKGGATGGGRAQVAPMDEINLHFTGDFHAIGAANNLLASLIDNHLYWGNKLHIDPRRVTWRRGLDLNDRALRHVVTGLGNGTVRETGFDITVASEVMAIFCLATSLEDLQQRLAKIVIGESDPEHGRRTRITAADLKAVGAMTALLKDALRPNLVQTLEGTPAFVHGGPFANIAHGCNSVLATQTALGLADTVVTEAGFGADLGAEKFLDIKCRAAGLEPAACVVVATIRALKMHGGVAKDDLAVEDTAAVRRGASNLRRHVENMRRFGLPLVVALNGFKEDTPAEIEAVRAVCADLDVPLEPCTHWADGGAGAEGLAGQVAALCSAHTARFQPLYELDLPLAEKLRTVARELYRADDISLTPGAAKTLADLERDGYGRLPVCIAKTQYSFTTDPNAKGAPEGFILPVREIRLAAGAGFVVALCGDILTMPGLPRHPAALDMRVDAAGALHGLD